MGVEKTQMCLSRQLQHGLASLPSRQTYIYRKRKLKSNKCSMKIFFNYTNYPTFKIYLYQLNHFKDVVWNLLRWCRLKLNWFVAQLRFLASNNELKGHKWTDYAEIFWIASVQFGINLHSLIQEYKSFLILILKARWLSQVIKKTHCNAIHYLKF